jgi:hypothetical protein
VSSQTSIRTAPDFAASRIDPLLNEAETMNDGRGSRSRPVAAEASEEALSEEDSVPIAAP